MTRVKSHSPAYLPVLQRVLAKLINIKFNETAYHRAPSPSHFTRLLGVGEEKYCRYLWSRRINKKKHSQWQPTGNTSKGRASAAISEFKSNAVSYLPGRAERAGSVDVFLSPNEFFDWRCTKNLSMLHANWLEIDTVNHEILSFAEQEALLYDVCQGLLESGLPVPTGFVTSGSGGIHFYWIYKGVEAYKWRVSIWRDITKKLCDRLRDRRNPNAAWEIDQGASADPARVLRLPGTFHGKSGQLVHGFTGGPVYDFDTLANTLLDESIEKRKPILKEASIKAKSNVIQLPPKKINQKTAPKKVVSGRHTIGQWWMRIYSALCTDGRINGVKEGRRDLFAFLAYVSLRHIKKDPVLAMGLIKELNKEVIGLQEDEIVAYLKTATETHYKFRKDTVASFLQNNLGINAEFLFENSKIKLSPKEVSLRRSNGATETATIKASKTLSSLTKAKQALKEAGIKATQAAIAELSGRSERTVRRYWVELSSQPIADISPVSIYTRPLEACPVS